MIRRCLNSDLNEVKGASHEDICWKNGPNKRKSKCKGPKAGINIALLRNSKEANVAATVSKRGEEDKAV